MNDVCETSETDDAPSVLVVGASGGIAGAVLRQFHGSSPRPSLYAVSRQKASSTDIPLDWRKSDYSGKSIDAICREFEEEKVQFNRIVICNGILHGEDLQPEKRIEQIDESRMLTVINANAIVPVLWLKSLLPLVERITDCRIAVLSARVGSIGDNRLGGWYSYRASKAALNMLLKTSAIEYARRAKGVKLIAFHPGTTDTGLSLPFQAAVPDDKLFEPEFVAGRLIDIMESAEADGTLAWLDWQGKRIEW